MNARFRFLMLIAATALTGCAVGPDYKETTPGTFSDSWFSGEQDGAATESIQQEWWGAFKDPLLDQYLQQAAASNKTLDIARSAVRSARAARREAVAGYMPQIGAGASASRSQASEQLSPGADAESLYEAGFDASWALDVFGGTRRAHEAASARYEGSIAQYNDVVLTVLVETARTYLEARGYQKQIAIAQKNSDLLEQTMELVRKREEVGESSRFDSARTEATYKQIQARIPNLEAELNARVFMLSVLLGQAPESLMDEMMQEKPLPVPPDIVPVGLRSDILRRRPDIRMAERTLAAETADIGVQMAELFPKFSLTGSIGSGAGVFGDVFTSAARTWSLGIPVVWRVFEGGAIRARILQEEEDATAALANYEQTVLESLRDAESALTRYGKELETRRRLEDAVKSRREAVDLAHQLFDAGEIDLLEAIDSERELVDTEDSLVQSEVRSVTNLVSLYAALGGGWESFPLDQEQGRNDAAVNVDEKIDWSAPGSTEDQTPASWGGMLTAP